ncbi:MAG TPA: hypothetical protein VFD58_24095 [Blastocatellia bacterium]|nr:hypothetical protein [Blastocatellia bacterium]
MPEQTVEVILRLTGAEKYTVEAGILPDGDFNGLAGVKRRPDLTRRALKSFLPDERH